MFNISECFNFNLEDFLGSLKHFLLVITATVLTFIAAVLEMFLKGKDGLSSQTAAYVSTKQKGEDKKNDH